MASVDVNGLTIEYERQGSGEPLLLVMGLGGQLTTWPIELIDALVNRGFEVIRFDNRDAGLSSEVDREPPSPVKAFLGRLLGRPVESGYQISTMADDAVGLLDALGIESAHLVGVSMGGMIAQTIAIRHESRVRSLTSIMSKPGDRSGGTSARVLLAMARMRGQTRERAVDDGVAFGQLTAGPHFDPVKYRPRVQAAVERSYRPEGRARQIAAIMASPDRTPHLQRLQVPALVIHGLADPLVKPSGGTATAEAIPGSKLVMFADMGHDLPQPRIDDIAEEIALVADRTQVEA